MINRRMRRWRDRSRISKLDTFSRAMFNVLPWPLLLGWVLLPMGSDLVREPLPLTLGAALLVCAAAQAVVGIVATQRALDQYLGKGRATRRQLVSLVVLSAACLALDITLVGTHGLKPASFSVSLAYLVAMLGGPFCLLMPMRWFAAAVAGLAGLLAGAFAAVGAIGGVVASTLIVVPGAGCFIGFIMRTSAWSLSLTWELEDAREVQARLAVAEERLRFGRDMHDVLGRNLAVIALKSELAVRLARRGRPEAVEQMVEVQRIAQESQREVRDVVRGYRKADLQVELAGARSVLRAAGIDCRIEGDGGTGLPDAVQSALGWVVREGTTNVLRHAPDARTCAIRTRVQPDRVALEMENDGVTEPSDPDGRPAAGTGAGSGLKGLRERLTPLGGTLQSERRPGGGYRLAVRLPVRDAVDENGAGAGADGPAAVAEAVAEAGTPSSADSGRGREIGRTAGKDGAA
ncbi:histidine kinase [Streptomyces sp. NPDC003077]|uniref:sensor histidine kinase n=1 Tax=Streptomyces sp. NPDC003077 TaxID=3154443 RepID=UPI0033A69F89